MALTKVTNSMVSGAPLNILDYGAVPNSEAAASANVVAIQAAIDAANAMGFGKVSGVYIPAGTFVIDGDITVKSYVALFGDGDQSIIKLKANVAAGTYNLLKIVGNSDNSIVLRDFSLWGDNNNQANSPTVYGLRISPPSSAIYYSNFQNLYVKEMDTNAVLIDQGGAENVQFNNCMFRDCKGDANFKISAGQRIEILGCRIRSGKAPGAGHGIFIDSANTRYIRVENCRIDDNLGWGVKSTTSVDTILVQNNAFVSNDDGGIEIADASYSVISGNSLTSHNPAIKVSGIGYCLISGNMVFESGDIGIYVNNCDGSIISNNVLNDASDGGNAAISLLNTDYCTISNNQINNCNNHGIELSNCDNNSISGNMLYNVGIETDNTYFGIKLTDACDYNLVQGNKSTTSNANKVQYVVTIQNANCDANMVINNDLLGYTTGAINDSGTGTLTTSANRTS